MAGKKSKLTLERWRESLGNTARLKHNLNNDQRMLVCSLLGQFQSPAEVTKELKAKYGIQVSNTAIYNYVDNPDWKPIIAKYRSEYIQLLASVAIFHKRVRLERLETQFQEVDRKPDNTEKPRSEKR